MNKNHLLLNSLIQKINFSISHQTIFNFKNKNIKLKSVEKNNS